MSATVTALEWMNNVELCAIKQIVGLPCPGCGMTRAFTHFFQLDLKGAFYYHPLFFLIPLIFGIFLFRKKVPLFGQLCQNKYIISGTLSVFLAVYILRISVLFPNTPPMDYNEHSVIATIYHWLVN